MSFKVVRIVKTLFLLYILYFYVHFNKLLLLFPPSFFFSNKRTKWGQQYIMIHYNKTKTFLQVIWDTGKEFRLLKKSSKNWVICYRNWIEINNYSHITLSNFLNITIYISSSNLIYNNTTRATDLSCTRRLKVNWISFLHRRAPYLM